MFRIPVYPLVSADFAINFLIEGTRVNLRFMWNTQTEYWMLNEYNEPDNGIRFTGIKVKPQYPLLENLITSLKGTLILGKTSKAVGSAIKYDNFGNGWDLFYLTESEYADWKVSVGL